MENRSWNPFTMRRRRLRSWVGLMWPIRLAIVAVWVTTSGCGTKPRTPTVIFLDGAGHFGYAGAVERGLRQSGYEGRFEQFVWSAFLGPGVDHLLVARAGGRANTLARKIERIRESDADGSVHLIGLSAGAAALVAALEQLDDGVMVDNVVLLSSSTSARHNLARALKHVRGHLYATASRRDGMLSMLAINADGGVGPPAGRIGVQLPRTLPPSDRSLYRKATNLPWYPAYAGYGWDGGHTSVTSPRFIASVIAPRLRSTRRFPLDRPLHRAAAP
ncbi:MAG: hypothetical protein GY842_13600 [bacterium]|nr:hypothetical protein [bacterium]